MPTTCRSPQSWSACPAGRTPPSPLPRRAPRPVAPDGTVLFAAPAGVFRLTPGGAAPTRAVGASFNSPHSLQPGLLHASPAGNVFVVGRPPSAWQPGACSGGGPGIYRFSFGVAAAADGDGASSLVDCSGAYPQLGRIFLATGRAMAGRAEGDAYALYLTTDSELLQCFVLSSRSGAMLCREVANTASSMGARFVFRGLALLP